MGPGGVTGPSASGHFAKCGSCSTYQTLISFAATGWNVYTYECENGTCDPKVTGP
jgi:hypothetical protein